MWKLNEFLEKEKDIKVDQAIIIARLTDGNIFIDQADLPQLRKLTAFDMLSILSSALEWTKMTILIERMSKELLNEKNGTKI